MLAQLQEVSAKKNKKLDLSRVMTGVPEGSRNATAAQVIGKLVRNADKDVLPMVWELIKIWNERNTPQMDTKELSSVFHSISAREFGNRELPHDLQVMTWGDVLQKDFPEIEWIVDKLLVLGSVNQLASESGVGKTWLGLYIAQCVCAGSPLFGRFQTIQSNVLYLDGENGLRALHDRGRILQFTDAMKDSLYFISDYELSLNSDDSIQTLIKIIQDKNIKLVIVDTFRSFSGFEIDENKAMDIRQFFKRFFTLRELGVTVLFMEHNRKPGIGEHGNPSKSQVLGSQDKLASVDSVLMLKKKPNSTTIQVHQVKQRHAREIEPFAFELVESGGFTSLEYREVDKEATALEKSKEEIFDLLESNVGAEYTIKELVPLVKSGRDSTDKALKELITEGLVESFRRDGSQAIWYRLMPQYSETELPGS